MTRYASWRRQQISGLWTRHIERALALLTPMASITIQDPTDRDYLKTVRAIRARQAKTQDRYAHAWVEEGLRIWRIR